MQYLLQTTMSCNSEDDRSCRYTNYDGTMSCITKQQKHEHREATDIIKKIDPIVAAKAVKQHTNHDVTAASKTNELLTQITEQLNDMKKQNDEMKIQHKVDMEKIIKQNDDLKEASKQLEEKDEYILSLENLIFNIEKVRVKIPY